MFQQNLHLASNLSQYSSSLSFIKKELQIYADAFLTTFDPATSLISTCPVYILSFFFLIIHIHFFGLVLPDYEA